jgi:hypothetical protein
MSTIRLGTRAVLTTDNPASSYGRPVLVLDDNGVALGPADPWPEADARPDPWTCAQVIATQGAALSSEQATVIIAWLGQLPPSDGRRRWITNIRRNAALEIA